MNVIMSAADMPLGLNVIEILLHIFNFIILIVAVRFLLYKPIKKFMDKRAQGCADEEADYARKKEEAEKMKAEAEDKIREAEVKAARIEDDANANAVKEADAILENARKDAKDIVARAEADMAAKEVRERAALSREVTSLALTMSSKILEREVNADDNEAVIAPLIEQFRAVHAGDADSDTTKAAAPEKKKKK